MEQTGEYGFSSISINTAEVEKEIEAPTPSFPTVKFVIMLVTGFLGIIVSPFFLAPMGLITGNMILGAIMVSLALGGVSSFIGEKFIRMERKIGWIGIAFLTIVILLIVVPIVYLFLSPI